MLGAVSLLLTAHQVRLLASSNIAASAATATTAQLTAPSGKTSGADFQAGFISDDTAAPILDLGSGKYTEVEFSLELLGLSAGDVVTFYATLDGQLADTVTVTPQITIASEGRPRWQNMTQVAKRALAAARV